MQITNCVGESWIYLSCYIVRRRKVSLCLLQLHFCWVVKNALLYLFSKKPACFLFYIFLVFANFLSFQILYNDKVIAWHCKYCYRSCTKHFLGSKSTKWLLHWISLYRIQFIAINQQRRIQNEIDRLMTEIRYWRKILIWGKNTILQQDHFRFIHSFIRTHFLESG